MPFLHGWCTTICGEHGRQRYVMPHCQYYRDISTFLLITLHTGHHTLLNKKCSIVQKLCAKHRLTLFTNKTSPNVNGRSNASSRCSANAISIILYAQSINKMGCARTWQCTSNVRVRLNSLHDAGNTTLPALFRRVILNKWPGLNDSLGSFPTAGAGKNVCKIDNSRCSCFSA